jgi:hypothetical protein
MTNSKNLLHHYLHNKDVPDKYGIAAVASLIGIDKKVIKEYLREPNNPVVLNYHNGKYEQLKTILK